MTSKAVKAAKTAKAVSDPTGSLAR